MLIKQYAYLSSSYDSFVIRVMNLHALIIIIGESWFPISWLRAVSIVVKLLHRSKYPGFEFLWKGHHAFTGCDYTSSFVSQWKFKPLRILTNSKQIQSVYQDLSNQPLISDKNRKGLEKFTCKMNGGLFFSNIHRKSSVSKSKRKISDKYQLGI